MHFFILSLALVATARGEGIPEKRGVAASQQAYTTSQQAYTAASPASIAYTKLQQPGQKTLVAAPQPQYYSQQVAAPAAYSFPTQQQYQYQPQAQPIAYAQPAAAQAVPSALAKVSAYRQPFSPANDVSSFTYSSPLVSYSNLGLLSQVVGRVANPGAVQTKVASAPAPAVYQQQNLQKVAYAQPSQLSYDTGVPSQGAKYSFAAQPAAAQQYFAQAPQQTFAASPPAQTYQPAQQYSAQAVPQALYSQTTQYYNPAQQVQQGKQAGTGISYAQ